MPGLKDRAAWDTEELILHVYHLTAPTGHQVSQHRAVTPPMSALIGKHRQKVPIPSPSDRAVSNTGCECLNKKLKD